MPFYSPTTQNFYCQNIHDQNIPADAITITDDEHMALIDGINNQGKQITIDATGHPTLTDAPPLPIDEQQENLNRRARAYLNSTDWMIIRQQETGIAVPPDILTRRALARRGVVDAGTPHQKRAKYDFSLV